MVEEISRHLSNSYGNPSSLHREGRNSRMVIEESRRNIAKLLNCSIGEIFFTSCGTESNNTVINGAVRDLGVERIITSPLEHPCVLEAIKAQGRSVDVHFVQLNEIGQADLNSLEGLLDSKRKTLVSLMHVNNEIGTVNDIRAIGELCKRYGALFHSDTVQGLGFYTYDLSDLPVDFISASAHKFHGPKGIGLLYINDEISIKPLLWGGHQERNMRAGTENVAYIAGIGKALSLAYDELDTRKAHIMHLRQHLIDQLSGLDDVRVVNPSAELNHYKIVNIAVPLNDKTTLAIPNLDIAGFAVSGGSACSSGAETTSHVYDALFPNEELKLIRVSFSHFNKTEEVDLFCKVLKDVIN